MAHPYFRCSGWTNPFAHVRTTLKTTGNNCLSEFIGESSFQDIPGFPRSKPEPLWHADFSFPLSGGLEMFGARFRIYPQQEPGVEIPSSHQSKPPTKRNLTIWCGQRGPGWLDVVSVFTASGLACWTERTFVTLGSDMK